MSSKWGTVTREFNQKRLSEEDCGITLSADKIELANFFKFHDEALSLNFTPFYYHWKPSMQSLIPRLLTNPALIKRKYVIKPHDKINLVGMLIGPKGMYHKMLEEISGCFMFIKGRNAMN